MRSEFSGSFIFNRNFQRKFFSVRMWDIKNDDMRSTKKCTMAEERTMEKEGHEAAKKGTDAKERLYNTLRHFHLK